MALKPPLAAYIAGKEAAKEDPNKAPLGAVDSVEELIEKYRGKPEDVRAGIQAAILGSVALASALSMIPFTSNFASDFAGSVLRDLTSPGVAVAINAPIRDYLENLFPTGELNVRLLVTGLEKGALTEEELIDTAVDSGVKDKEILKLLKIAKVARFDRETEHDYDLIARFENALISAELQTARDDVDDAINERLSLIKEYEKIIREQAMEEAAAGAG